MVVSTAGGTMAMHEIYLPELDTIVRFRILTLEEGQFFCLEHEDIPPAGHKKAVLEKVVFNLKSDVAVALKKIPKEQGEQILDQLYSAAIMFNPAMNFPFWLNLSKIMSTSNAYEGETNIESPRKRRPNKEKVSKAKFFNLERHLKERVIGQDEAVDEITVALKRSYAGLQDGTSPLGVFLFAGASGIGKTHLARELHKYLFGDKYDMVRIDCGEYQHKHENQKLIGSPAGYYGYDDGGILTNKVAANPKTVVLLDEVEKAHPDIMNTFLRVFDEGMITDNHGNEISFRETIIIMTTNLGNERVVDNMMGKRVGFGQKLYTTAEESVLPRREGIVFDTNAEIRKHFKPELLNRIDRIIVFNHLGHDDYAKIADLELQLIQSKLDSRGYEVSWDSDVIQRMLESGVNPVEGARRLSRIRRADIEDPLADVLLEKTYPRGTIFQISPSDGRFDIHALVPTKKVVAP